MTVNISKRMLGIACIIAGALILLIPPILILSILTLLFPGFDPREAARPIQFTSLIPLTVLAVSGIRLVNLRESSEARGRGGTSLEQLPRNAATLLTGAVGMLLLFIHLFEGISSSSRISPTAALFVYALTSTVLLMETA